MKGNHLGLGGCCVCPAGGDGCKQSTQPPSVGTLSLLALPWTCCCCCCSFPVGSKTPSWTPCSADGIKNTSSLPVATLLTAHFSLIAKWLDFKYNGMKWCFVWFLSNRAQTLFLTVQFPTSTYPHSLILGGCLLSSP